MYRWGVHPPRSFFPQPVQYIQSTGRYLSLSSFRPKTLPSPPNYTSSSSSSSSNPRNPNRTRRRSFPACSLPSSLSITHSKKTADLCKSQASIHTYIHYCLSITKHIHTPGRENQASSDSDGFTHSFVSITIKTIS